MAATPGEVVLKELGWWSMEGRRDAMRLRYFARLVYLKSNRIVKRIFVLQVPSSCLDGSTRLRQGEAGAGGLVCSHAGSASEVQFNGVVRRRKVVCIPQEIRVGKAGG